MCCQRTRDSPVFPFGGAVNFFSNNENRNERETVSGVPNMLRPLREPGVIGGPAAAAAVASQVPGAAGLPTGPAPAQQAQGVVYNARHNGSHFIDEGAQDMGGGGEKTACPSALFRLRSREAEGARKLVPQVIVA